MKRILKELYFGNINPYEKRFLQKPDLDKAISILFENERKLTELLDEEEKQMFLDIVKAETEISEVHTTENFISGFRLGAKIMLEILSEDAGCLMDL